MQTECRQQSFTFQALGSRAVVAGFDGGTITSDAGALLLRELADRRRFFRQLADCFRDHRNPGQIEHTVEQLISQRVVGLALGYEDLVDHDELCRDPLLATVVGKSDPLGQDRRRASDAGKPLAGKSTLNRLELRPKQAKAAERYTQVEILDDALDAFFVLVMLQAHRQVPEVLVFDLDATDDIIHGKQEGRHFHGYYDNYCYLPLYIFCGDFLLCARLRESNIDASKGSVEELTRIIAQVRRWWPEVRIIVRADSGFAREELMAWCEAEPGVEYVLGLAKNARLLKMIEAEAAEAATRHASTGKAERVFAELRYKTLETWSRERRVVAKVEHLEKGANPRFIVTSLSEADYDTRALYEQLYCARGEMENRIKEQQLDLFADRTSATRMRANQIRLWFSSLAYVLMNEVRRVGLEGTDLEQATCGTLRLKLLKIGARVAVSVRRVLVSMSSSYPYQELFAQVLERVRGLECPPGGPPLRC